MTELCNCTKPEDCPYKQVGAPFEICLGRGSDAERERSRGYRRAWDSMLIRAARKALYEAKAQLPQVQPPREPKPRPAKVTPRVCPHKGAELRLEFCPGCRGGRVEIKVFACSLHGECTVSKAIGNIHVCDYRR